MHSKRLTILLPLLVVATMLASLITPAPVLAAGEPPPPPGEQSPKAQPAPAKPAPPAADSSYTAEIPVASPAGRPDGAANAAAVALSVAAIAQAGAVLVGPDGSLLPLAAQETAGMLNVVGDVYFKGSGAGCSGGVCKFDTIAAALTAFPGDNGSGVIYATGNLNELNAVDVINTALLNLSKLTGLAWDGTTNYSPRITGGPLTIANMLKGFSVDGFYISKGINAHDNAGTLRLQNLSVTSTTGHGIDVTNHKGNIDLYNVTVVNANGDGALLDNTAGAGNITVGNSTFDSNGNYGIEINTHGSVLLDRVEASSNPHADGAHLVMGKGATVKDSRFDGNQNGSSGLTINGTGAISLQNVEARLNTAFGVFLGSNNDITINGGLFLTNTSNNGLKATSSGGNITLNNVVAQANNIGVVLDNHLSTTPKTVTVNNSQFLANTGMSGLFIAAKGNVTLNHIRAEANAANGITIDNAQLDAGGVYTGSGSVSILNTSGSNELIDNHIGAIYIKTKGAITIKGVNALSNGFGLWLDGCAIDKHPAPGTTPNCLGKGNLSVTATNVAQSNSENSLAAGTGGAITLDGDNFQYNAGGVALNNALVSSAKTVTVTNSTFSNSTVAGAIPSLWVQSKGNITLNNVQALANATTDVTILLDNCLLSGSTCRGSGSVSLLNSLGSNIIMGNTATIASLSISSHGAITLNGVVADYNRSGAGIETLGAAAVTISKSSFSHNTFGNGLHVGSAGKITLTSVNVSFNNGGSGGGATLANTGPGATASATITVSKSAFNNNRSHGLQAYSWGNLTLNNISASGNIGSTAIGADLLSLKGTVAVQDSLGANQFSFNGEDGLLVTSGSNQPGTWGGTISLSGVIAYNNVNGYGITVTNQYATTPKAVTIQKVRADANGTDGLSVQSKGNVTLNNVQANANPNGWGVRIDNCLSPGSACTGNGNVSILSTLGPNSASNNKTGVRIETFGSVTLNGLSANFNNDIYISYSGVWINNQFPGAASKPVTVTQSSFDSNQGRGLTIYATGLITLNGISASHNTGVQGYGLYLDNSGVTGSPGVSILATLGNNQFNYNGAPGIKITSSGAIALNKVAANNNGFVTTTKSGVYLQIGGTSTISITCSAFNNNRWYGLEVVMGSGALNFKSVSASNNMLGTNDFSLGGKTPVVSWTVCGK